MTEETEMEANIAYQQVTRLVSGGIILSASEKQSRSLREQSQESSRRPALTRGRQRG